MSTPTERGRGRGRGGGLRGGRGGTRGAARGGARGGKRGLPGQDQKQRQPRIKAVGKGLVKAVLSGDTIILQGVQKQGDAFPPEREITLSGVQAPRFARSKNTPDGAWAWHSREFLRKKILGKPVSFQLVYHHERDGKSRDYCNVKYEETDLASLVVANGWATVQQKEGKSEGGQPPKIHPEKQALIDLEKKAKEAGLGMHNQQVSSADKIRFFPTVNASELLEKMRNIPLPAVVDKVIDGSTIRVELLGDDTDPLKHYVIPLRLAGVECEQTPMPPPFGSQPKTFSQPPKWDKKGSDGDEAGDGEDADGEEEEEEESWAPKPEKPKPYAIEAQKYVEARLLHRDVKVLLQGSDGNHAQANLYGSLQFEKGNITEKLLETGFGRYVKWSAALTGASEKLARIEAEAKNRRQGLWTKWVAPQETDDKSSPRDFFAKVTQVISGDRIAVEIEDPTKDPAEPVEEKRFPLASIRCPRLGTRGGPNEDWALDAREWLRKKLVGKKVRVVVEYEREPLPEAVDQTKQQYVSVYINKLNVNEGLVEAGLARTNNHRRNEDRAENWDRLLTAEHKAQKAGLGLHGRSRPPISSAIIDLTGFAGRGRGRGRGGRGGRGRGRGGRGRGGETETYQPVGQQQEEEETKEYGSVSRAGVFLSGLQKSQQHALVEYVFSGSRFKLWVQSQNLICFFVLAGIRSPRNDNNSPNEWTHKATEFVRQRILQKNVVIETETTDKAEVNFVGTLLYNGQNLSIDLLREGLASVWDASARDSPNSQALYEAQKTARDQKIGIWKNWVEEPAYEEGEEYEEDEEYDGEQQKDEPVDNHKLAQGKDVKVKVTEIVDACTFYVHIVEDANVSLVEEAMKNFNDDKVVTAEDAKSGKVYAGLFPSEGTWHRVRLETKTQSGQWRGLFIDYGNRENLDLANLRHLDEDLKKITPTAYQMFLAALKAPGEGSEYFEPAGQAFSDLVWDRELVAHVELVDSGKYHVTLRKPGSETSINQLLLEAAWIRVHPRPHRRLKDKGARGDYTELYKDMLKHEEVGKLSRKHIWEYGDVSDEEEDARDDRGRVPSKKAKEKEAKDKEAKKEKEKEKEKKKAETKPKEKSDKGGKGGAKGKADGKAADGKAAAPAKGGAAPKGGGKKK